MFKDYIYLLCQRMHALRGRKVFVPGVCYGKHLFELASCRPKQIVACDLSEYPEEWDFIRTTLRDQMGVDVVFLKGDIDDPRVKNFAPFDWIISEGVLEHVKDPEGFLKGCRRLLTDDGHFYASFGPLWYGPGGDHLNWGEGGQFHHLVLSQEEYAARIADLSVNADLETMAGIFLYRHKLFSYLHARQYLEVLNRSGLAKRLLWVKYCSATGEFFRKNPGAALPATDTFDQYCSGMYLWARRAAR